MSVVDWAGFARRNWNVGPAVMSTSDMTVDGDLAYAVIAGAAEPFRAGIRFGALPDVQFFVPGGQLRSPGPLLPGPDDPTMADYVSRLGNQAFCLIVQQPLMTDFRLWSQVRDLVTPLWRQVGIPTMPVVTELVLAHDITHRDESPPALTHAALTLVLRGSIQVDLAEAGMLSGEAGDLLYWPAGHPHSTTYLGNCLVLRLSIATEARLAALLVRDVLADLVQGQRESNLVPYLPYPPPRDRSGGLPAIEELVDIRARLADADLRAQGERILGVRWARLASAAGLAPVPAPRAPRSMSAEDRFRVSAEIVRARTDNGEWIWAINGHAFQVAGPAAGNTLARLRFGAVVSVAELCGGPSTGSMAALLRRIYQVRGLEPATGGQDR